jgi:hypothetical protein
MASGNHPTTMSSLIPETAALIGSYMTTNTYMVISMSQRIGMSLPRENRLFPVDTDAQKAYAMRWLVGRLSGHYEGWTLAYHHDGDEEGNDGDEEYLCYDYDPFTVGENSTHFAIPTGNDAEYLSLYKKVATKGLDDSGQWHPMVWHLPEMMSIHTGVMYR